MQHDDRVGARASRYGRLSPRVGVKHDYSHGVFGECVWKVRDMYIEWFPSGPVPNFIGER